MIFVTAGRETRPLQQNIVIMTIKTNIILSFYHFCPMLSIINGSIDFNTRIMSFCKVFDRLNRLKL